MSDPYTTRDDAKQPPPVSWAVRCRQLGPSIVISGSIVGSGELILTSGLGVGVLHASGQQPQGLETVEVLSAMFTNTFGGWSLWLVGGAALLPVQSGATIWLQRRRMDARVRPSAAAHVLLWLTFLFQLSMAALVAWFIVR